MKITITAPDIQGIVEEVVGEVTTQAQECLLQLGMEILDNSAARVPVWTGALISTGFIKEQENKDVTIGYASDPAYDTTNYETGKKVSEYAWEVHEIGTVYNIFEPVWVSGEGDSPGHYKYVEVEVQTAGPYKFLTEAANDVMSHWQDYFKELPLEVVETDQDRIELEDLDGGVVPF